MISQQARAWMDSLGDAWLERNRNDIGKKFDDVEHLIEHIKFTPTSILELGCSNGWRLNRLQRKYNCPVLGIDPSTDAIKEAEAAARHHPSFIVGTSDQIPTADETFDLIILGFCMWCTAPEDWFKVVAETTRVLKEGGVLIIHDYATPRSYRRLYSRDLNGERPLFTYCYNWPSLWLSHAGYKQIGEKMRVPKWEMATALRKNFVNTVMMFNEEEFQ